MPESPQKDRFAHDRLPPKERWPEILLPPEIPETGPLNCTHALLDRHLEKRRGNAAAHVRATIAPYKYPRLAEKPARPIKLIPINQDVL